MLKLNKKMRFIWEKDDDNPISIVKLTDGCLVQ